MSNGHPTKDKTNLFQAFESELKASGVRAGLIPTALKDIEEALLPYFENKAVIPTALGIGALCYEGAFLLRKIQDSWVSDCVNTLLGEFRAAKAANPASCFDIWSDWRSSTGSAIRNSAYAAQLQGNKVNLDSGLLVKSCLRDTADIIEGSLQIFARLRLKMIGLVHTRSNTRKTVEELSLGELIDELSQVEGCECMYKPRPFSVSLSQWRNIASHNGYQTSGNQVLCTYGTPRNKKSFSCTTNDITSIAVYTNDLTFAHKIAIEIFGIDNHDFLRKGASQESLSDFTIDSVLAFGIAAANFSVKKAIFENGIWNLELFDRRGRNSLMIKKALQEATVSYTLMTGGCHIEATVTSLEVIHKIGFKTATANMSQISKAEIRGDVFELDEHFRLKAPPAG